MVQEPHALLRQRERDAATALHGSERHSADGSDSAGEPFGELSRRRCLEQHAHPDVDVQCGVEPRDHASGDQRVAAELEEIVIDAYPLDAEYVDERIGDPTFELVPAPGIPHRFR